MEKPANNFSIALDKVSEFLGRVAAIFVLAMVFLVTFNVITRKILNWSIPGFYEILGLLGAVFYSFGIVYCATKGQHIMMDMVVNKVPAQMRKILDFFSRLIILMFSGLMVYAGVDVVLGMLDEKTDDLLIPVAPFRFLVVIAFSLLVLIILGGKQIGKGGEE